MIRVEDLIKHPIIAGFFFVLTYWSIESGLHSCFFGGGPFIKDLINPDIHELWMRIFVVVLLISFSLYNQNIINRLRKTETALLDQKKEALDILEYNPAAILLVDCVNLHIAYANNNASQLIGADPEELYGRKCRDFLCKSGSGQCPALERHTCEHISEAELNPVNNTPVPVLRSVRVIQFRGRPHLLEAFFDVGEQKKMRDALLRAHAELEQIFQTATVGMRLIDSNYNILKINKTFSLLAGIPAEDAIGQKCHEIFAGNMCHTSDCSLRRINEGDFVKDSEVTKIRSDGSILTCNLTVTPFRQPDGTVGVVESFKDITELKRIYHELEAERDRLHDILFHQFESVGIITDTYQVQFQNELMRKQTRGRENLRCYELFMGLSTPCSECCMQQSFAFGTVQRFEFDTADGKSYQHTYTPFIDNDGRRKAVVSQLDITERKASEAAVFNSEQLAALGELAAGVAHEINNPINGIINYAQVLANKSEYNSFSQDIARRIISEGDRIAAIVASLLSFARREGESRILVKASELLQESLVLAATQLKKNGIKINVTIEENLPPIFVVGQEIQQVFMNIISNSRYALNQKFPAASERKRLDIKISLVHTDSRPFVRISFTDSGTGIEDEVIDKICNPFFSTKPKGKGTGLGLSISKKIVEKHDGELVISSVFGEYTRVSLVLPAHLAGCPARHIQQSQNIPADSHTTVNVS